MIGECSTETDLSFQSQNPNWGNLGPSARDVDSWPDIPEAFGSEGFFGAFESLELDSLSPLRAGVLQRLQRPLSHKVIAVLSRSCIHPFSCLLSLLPRLCNNAIRHEEREERIYI